MAGRYKGLFFITVLLALALVWGFWPRPLRVETGQVARCALQVTVEEVGRTRVKQRYVLYAPVAGYLRRVALEAGDPIEAGETLAVIDPLPAAMLDPRARAEAAARVAAAHAAVDSAQARRRQAESEAALAAAEARRVEALFTRQLVSRAEYDQAESRKQALAAAARAAAAAVEVAHYEQKVAEAALSYAGALANGTATGPVTIAAPVGGRVLRRLQVSAGVVPAGHPLLEIGDPSDLEVEVQVLSHDAVRIQPGGRVLFDRWGGEEVLAGTVRTVEPAGFTKISALGVEEQRVWVIVDFNTPPATWRGLGDGYRVEARFITWEGDDVLTVPASALFRRENSWAAFVVRERRARLAEVQVGQSSGLLTEILGGLTEGDVVVIHPDGALEDGVRVEAQNVTRLTACKST